MDHLKRSARFALCRRGLPALIALSLIPLGALQADDLPLLQHKIEWSGSMPASTHTGLLTPQSFQLAISDQGTIEKLEIVLDMKSIDVIDLKGKNRDKLIGHLLSEDFFFVEKFPTARFEMKRFADGKLFGDLTIRGITHPAEIPVTLTREADQRWKLSGSLSFDRQRFNVNYQNSGFFGLAKDKVIRDTVELKVELLAGQP